MAKDLLMNACGDLDITGGVATLVSGADQVRQAWVIRMRTYLGEWFLNQLIGLPFTQRIFSKVITSAELKKIINDETLKTPGVLKVNKIILGTLDSATRSMEVTVYADIEGEENALFKYTGTVPAGGC